MHDDTMESTSSSTVDDISAGIDSVGITVGGSISGVMSSKESASSEKKCTSCEQKLDNNTDGVDASISNADKDWYRKKLIVM